MITLFLMLAFPIGWVYYVTGFEPMSFWKRLYIVISMNWMHFIIYMAVVVGIISTKIF